MMQVNEAMSQRQAVPRPAQPVTLRLGSRRPSTQSTVSWGRKKRRLPHKSFFLMRLFVKSQKTWVGDAGVVRRGDQESWLPPCLFPKSERAHGSSAVSPALTFPCAGRRVVAGVLVSPRKWPVRRAPTRTEASGEGRLRRAQDAPRYPVKSWGSQAPT